jgi:hypothetical protein
MAKQKNPELNILDLERTSKITLTIPKNQVGYFLEGFSIFMQENGHDISCCQEIINSFVFKHTQENQNDQLQIEIKEIEESGFFKWLKGFCQNKKLNLNCLID